MTFIPESRLCASRSRNPRRPNESWNILATDGWRKLRVQLEI